MIETLSLRNFKALREVDVRLRPLTLIVGPNSSGKSTLLQALAGITQIRSEHARAAEFAAAFGGPPEEFYSFVANGPLALECTGSSGGEAWRFHIEPGAPKPSHLEIRARSLGAPEENIWRLRPATVMSLDVKRMAATSFLKETNQALPSNGEGISTILADLYLEHPSRYQDLVARLKQVIPSVQDLRVRRTSEGYELLFDMLGAKGIPASAVSEGTLLTLGLLTLLVLPNPPQLVLIDDLERGLHPRAMGSLIKQFRFLQQQNPDLQVVATTHSPYLLDYVAADEVLLTSLSDDGYAAVKPLTDHPDYERWKDVMAPGEFWSTVGEGWVTEQPHK
jgi:predicted ATPase